MRLAPSHNSECSPVENVFQSSPTDMEMQFERVHTLFCLALCPNNKMNVVAVYLGCFNAARKAGLGSSIRSHGFAARTPQWVGK